MATTRNPSGFTLIEVLIAVAISAAVMISVSATFISTMRTHREVESITESTQAGSRILSLIERDLKALWIYNVKNNKVLIGKSRNLNGEAADRIDFLTSTDSISTIQDVSEKPAHTSVCEVGYWLRPNPDDTLLMQLWRREDPMVDDDLERGGTFQLVHDRLRSFNITYYKTLGQRAEQLEEWDSSKNDELPRRIKIEFTIERKLASANDVSHSEVDDFENNNKKYTHHIVLEKDYMDILKPKVALIPVLPTRPGKEAGGEGGNAGGNENEGLIRSNAPRGRASGFTEVSAGAGKPNEGRRNQGGNRGKGQIPGMGRGGLGNNPFGQGRGSPNINELFRQFGGGGRGNNPFGGGR